MKSGTDIAILGGGLAGLSLAVQLIRHRIDARITLIEPRRDYTDDRTWCFWDTMDHPFRHAISHRWPRWRVTTTTHRAETVSTRYPYCRLPAGAFYEQALAMLGEAPNVVLALGHAVKRVTSEARAVRISTDAGPIAADWAFDARTPDSGSWPIGRHPWLGQDFEGWRVQTEQATWDPEAVDLMDFTDRPNPDAIGFLYTLPLAPDEALVESTAFRPADAAGKGDHPGHIARALEHQLGSTGYRIKAREAGTIPMTTAPPPVTAGERIIAIGTRAGAPRPSSGYAFLPIQRHARRLAEQLARGQEPTATVRGPGTRWLDGVFLRRLRRAPDDAAELFRRLFERVPPDRLVRFLTETGTLADHIAVMSALPMGPFTREAVLGPWRPLPKASGPAC